MLFSIITIFPEMFTALNSGIPARAQQKDLISINCINLRDFSSDKHRRVDDRPFGGGPGMVMQYEPLKKAIEHAKQSNSKKKNLVIHLTPQGKLLTQNIAEQLATKQHLILLSGRYEGIDERLIEDCVDEEISIGDYVLSGGELPAMVLIDTITRLLPGALGDSESAQQDSFSSGLLDYPHYTRPEVIADRKVPDVLLSGDHQKIAKFRLKQALKRTLARRPELLQQRKLSQEELELLHEE